MMYIAESYLLRWIAMGIKYIKKIKYMPVTKLTLSRRCHSSALAKQMKSILCATDTTLTSKEGFEFTVFCRSVFPGLGTDSSLQECWTLVLISHNHWPYWWKMKFKRILRAICCSGDCFSAATLRRGSKQPLGRKQLPQNRITQRTFGGN